MALKDILFSESFLFEGEQKDAYLARKVAEKKAQERSEEERLERRNHAGSKVSTHYYYDDIDRLLKDNKDDTDRIYKSRDIIERDSKGKLAQIAKYTDKAVNAKDRGNSKEAIENIENAVRIYANHDRATNSAGKNFDPINRHIRRHPKQYKK